MIGLANRPDDLSLVTEIHVLIQTPTGCPLISTCVDGMCIPPHKYKNIF